MDYRSTANKIISLKKADLELREELIQKGLLGQGYNEEMESLHNKNSKILNDIIDTIGYPTVDKIGKEASEAAWLVIQHSIGQPDFMRKCKNLLEKAINEENANPINLAYLTDRIAVYEGRLQHYGTQFNWDENGNLNPYPFDDLARVNKRRRSLGLNTIEEQTKIIRQQAIDENQSPPADLDKRKEEIEDWRREKGWIK